MSGTVQVRITHNDTGEVIYEGQAWGVDDALVLYYCDNHMERRTIDLITDICECYGDAIVHGRYLAVFEGLLNCKCEVI